MEKIFGGLVVTLLLCGAALAEITNYKRVCYYGSWGFYKKGIHKFSPDNIVDTSICTHYMYAFAGVDSKNKTIIPLDPLDESENGYQKITSKKDVDPTIKVILSVGGWVFGVEEFAKLTNSTESIDTFCVNAIQYLRKWNFDGVDVDWEYPAQRGGGPEDRDKFATLMEKLRNSFEMESLTTGNPRLLLTSAVPITKYIIDKGYDRKRIGNAVDFLNIMVYDLYGAWSDTVGHHAALYSRISPNSVLDPQLTVEWGMKYWADEVSKEKLILGVPIYSRTFTMNTTAHPLGDWNLDAGIPFTKCVTTGYYEICNLIRDGTWKEGWDEEQSAPFAFSDTQWAGYDTKRSINLKANFVKDNQYGGIMVWQLATDDFTGLYCGKGKFPIMNAIKQSLTGSRDECKVDSYGNLNQKGCKQCPLYTYQPRPGQTSCIEKDITDISRFPERSMVKHQFQRSQKADLLKLQIISGVFGSVTVVLLIVLIIIASLTYRRLNGQPNEYKVHGNEFNYR